MADAPKQAGELTRAETYRARAQEIRAMAMNGVDPETKTALLKIADDYDAMAVSRESVHSTNAAMEAGRRI
jgi:hypothetical protein